MPATIQETGVARRRTVLSALSGKPEVGGRLASLDALRGFTILVMIFVNDVAGVSDTPGWMKHMEPAQADGMTFVDIVFPAFLFIVGMSIPFALERRFERGGSIAGAWSHVGVRAISLLIIGVLMVNTEHISDNGILHPSLWTILMYAGVILVWLSPPRSLDLSGGMQNALKWVGAGLLLVLALIYRGEEIDGLIQLRPYWWGILGIIGWSYLAASAAFLIFRRDTTALLGVMVLLYCAYAANATGFFAWLPFGWINPGSIASHGALTVSGVVLGIMLMPGSRLKTHGQRMRWALLYGAALAASAILLHSGADVHRIFIINKIYATIPWGLWCAAITIWVWMGFYWLLDVAKQRRWTLVLEQSGQNALLAYIMAPIFYAGFSYAAYVAGSRNVYAALGDEFVVGFLRAVLFAIAVVWLAAVFRRRGYLLKL